MFFQKNKILVIVSNYIPFELVIPIYNFMYDVYCKKSVELGKKITICLKI